MQIKIIAMPYEADTVSRESLHALETLFDTKMFYIIFYIIRYH